MLIKVLIHLIVHNDTVYSSNRNRRQQSSSRPARDMCEKREKIDLTGDGGGGNRSPDRFLASPSLLVKV